MKREPQAGDWVRLYRNGRLVVSVVQYVKKCYQNDACAYRLLLEDGETDEQSVVEVRSVGPNPLNAISPEAERY